MVHAAVSRARLAALLAILLAVPAAADVPGVVSHELDIRVRIGQAWRPVDVTDPASVRSVLSRAPATGPASTTGPAAHSPGIEATLAILGEPGVLAEARRFASLSGRPKTLAVMNPASSTGQLVVGEPVFLSRDPRDETFYTVREGDTWESIAAAHGMTPAALKAINQGSIPRFESGAFARQAYGDGVLAVASFSESGMGALPAYWQRFVVIHEFGHTGEYGGCGRGPRYGPDGKHYVNEIIPPYNAWVEGWANYAAVHDPSPLFGGMASKIKPVEFTFQPTLSIETSTSGKYRSIPAADLTPGDLFSNEGWVAAILWNLEHRLGRATLEAALRVGQGKSCRHLGSYLGDLLTVRPTARATVKAVLEELPVKWDKEDQIDHLLATGMLPYCQNPWDLPRGRDAGGAGTASPTATGMGEAPAIQCGHVLAAGAAAGDPTPGTGATPDPAAQQASEGRDDTCLEAWLDGVSAGLQQALRGDDLERSGRDSRTVVDEVDGGALFGQ